jgi:uncharacterized protein YebE (UPF0316 family)
VLEGHPPMDLAVLAGSDLYTYVVIPVLIFFARICDQSMGTIRVIFVSRGFRNIAPLIGFFEIAIWLMAIGQIMQNLNNPVCYIAYAGGFASGIYVGMKIEDRLSIGVVGIRIIIKDGADDLIAFFREGHYGVTTMDAEGAFGPVKMIFSVVNRRVLPAIIGRIRSLNPHAFYSIEDVRNVNEGVFPAKSGMSLSTALAKIRMKH